MKGPLCMGNDNTGLTLQMPAVAIQTFKQSWICLASEAL